MAGGKKKSTVVKGKGKKHKRVRTGGKRRFVLARQKFYLQFKMSDPKDPAKLITVPEGLRARLMANGKPLSDSGATAETDADGKVTLAPNFRTIWRQPNYHFRIDLEERTYYDIDTKKLVKSATIKEWDTRNLMELPMVIDTKTHGFHYDESKLKLTEGVLKHYRRTKKGEGTEGAPIVLEVHFYWYPVQLKYYNLMKDGDDPLDVPRGMPVVAEVEGKDYISRYVKSEDDLGYRLTDNRRRMLCYLKLLGFFAGDVATGGRGTEVADGLKKFQKQYGLEENGNDDEATKAMIEQVFFRRTIGVYDAGSYRVPAWKPKQGLTKVYFELAQPGCKLVNADTAAQFDLFLHTSAKGADPKIIYRKKIEEDNKDDADKGIPFEKLAFEKKRQYYDLPVKWSSRNYWTRYDNDMKKGGRFDAVMTDKVKLHPFDPDAGKRADLSKPLMFSLDDIVMVKDVGAKKLTQDVQDKTDANASTAFKKDTGAAKDGSRMTLFHIKNDDLVVHAPEEAKQGYFSKAHAAGANLEANLITNVPKQARLIAFANDFYDISDKRAAQKNEHFVAAKHVLGCRAAVKDDPDCRFGMAIKYQHPNPFGHTDYFGNGTGNFELHYIHNGCPISGKDSLTIRSFLLIYWNGRFVSAAAPKNVAPAKVRTFEVEGTKNAKERWEDKGYTFEPRKKVADGGKCKVQIKPVFFFEGKKPGIGGMHKCKVTVSSDSSTGWMASETSDMYSEDYKINNYLFSSAAEARFTDIDGKRYEMLTVAHELGHANGKLDDYAYWYKPYGWPVVPEDKTFSQWYIGMPYQIDIGSMMKDNRAPRMRMFFNYLNWVNDYAKKDPGMKKMLKDAQFDTVHRFGDKTLRHGLPSAVRNIYKPYKLTRRHPLGTGTADLMIYRLGTDETAHNLPINKVKPLPPKAGFDAILVVSIKIGVTFKNSATLHWPVVDGKRDSKFWRQGLFKALDKLNGRFYLKGAGDHDFKKMYVKLFPMVYVMTGPDASTHYDIEVTANNSSSVSQKSGKTLKVGNEVNKNWLANYILGDDDGAFVAFFKWTLGLWSLGSSELKFARTWARTEIGDNSYSLEDALW